LIVVDLRLEFGLFELDGLSAQTPGMTTLVSLTGKEQSLKLTGFYGAATPVHEFEKLNQIGEGSTFRLRP
jgi:hypothetical protein